MPPPQSVVCEICGGKYSKHSLIIHQRQCVVKREASTVYCPSCSQLVSNDEYGAHVTKCRDVNERATREKKLAVAKATKAVARGGAAAAAGAATLAVVAGAAAASAAAAAKPRSKIPEAVLRRLEAARLGTLELTPEQKLIARLGSPCDACGASAACAACVGCHQVFCAPCCDGLHEDNKGIADHKPILKAVSDRGGGVLAQRGALCLTPLSTFSLQELAASAAAAEAAAAALAAVDSRLPCGVCARMFDPARIAKHQLVCTIVRAPCVTVGYSGAWCPSPPPPPPVVPPAAKPKGQQGAQGCHGYDAAHTWHGL